MPKLKKKIDSRRDYLKPYFAPSGSRPGVQVRLPNLPPTLDNTSLNIKTGNRPGSNPSNPNSRGSNAWSDFDKYGGRALLIGTGAHLAYKGGKYLQQRFLTSQGRNFAPGNEPVIPRANVEPPVQGEFLPDDVPSGSVGGTGEGGTIEMANLGDEAVVGEGSVVSQAASTSEGFFSKIVSGISKFFTNTGDAIADETTELTPLLTEGGEAAAEVLPFVLV
jgi:hypothetical protein